MGNDVHNLLGELGEKKKLGKHELYMFVTKTYPEAEILPFGKIHPFDIEPEDMDTVYLMVKK